MLNNNKKTYEFREFKKDGTLKNTKVNANSRMYADTYEEAVEMYNEYVQFQIDKLNKLIESCKQDFIK